MNEDIFTRQNDESKTVPVRLQLKRTKGFDFQVASLETNGLPGLVVTRQTRWGNPFKIKDGYTLKESLGRFEDMIAATDGAPEDIRRELRGHNLFCYCRPGAPCHADLLLAIANEIVCESVAERVNAA
jgi:hypothetical protein